MSEKSLYHIYEYKSLINNISYLSALQILSLLFPFITYPYLIRVFGKDLFGVYLYSQAVIAYFVIFINFGFNITATKKIAENKNDLILITEVVSSVIIIKTVLLIIALIILVVLIITIEEINKYSKLYFINMLACAYEVIFPLWLFQGLEKMKYVAMINIISKAFFTIMVFVFVKEKNDLLLLSLLNGIGAMLGGILSLYIVVIKMKVVVSLQSLATLKYYLLDSYTFFISRAASVVMLKTNVIILGNYASYEQVSYYDLGFRILEIAKIPASIINQAIYPYIARTKNYSLVKKLIKYNILMSFIIVVLIWALDVIIIEILSGPQMSNAKNIILLLNITIPIVSTSWFLGNCVLVVGGYSNCFNNSILWQSIVYILCLLFIIAIDNINMYTVSMIYIVSAMTEMGYRALCARKYRLLG